MTTFLRATFAFVGPAALLIGGGALLAGCGQKGPLRPAQTAGPSGGPSTSTPPSTAAPAASPAAASSTTR